MTVYFQNSDQSIKFLKTWVHRVMIVLSRTLTFLMAILQIASPYLRTVTL